MKHTLGMLLFAVSLSMTSAEDEKKPITITPMLGAEFGKIIEIEGKIVDDTDTRQRADLGKRLIEVNRVGDIKLKNPVVVELIVFSFTDIVIPARGTQVRFRGYESGGFSGIPTDTFKDVGLVSSTDHQFENWFQITKRLEPTRTEGVVAPNNQK